MTKLAYLLKFIQSWWCQGNCDHAVVQRGKLMMAIFSHHSEGVSEILSCAFRVNNWELALRRCRLEKSSCSCKFGCGSFMHKTCALSNLFSYCRIKKTWTFLWATMRLGFAEHFNSSQFCIKTKSYSRSVELFSLWPNFIADCEVWWFVNLIVWKFFQLWSLQPIRSFEAF